MKRRLSMRCLSCLKTVSRKIRFGVHPGVFAPAALLMLLVPAELYALESHVSAVFDGSGVKVSVLLDGYDEQGLIQAAAEGLRSEIEYTFRVYGRTDGLLGMFGDTLLHEESLRLQGRYDAFSKAFVIEEPDGTRHQYDSFGPYLSSLVHLKDYRFDIPGHENIGEAVYIESRVEVRPVRLAPAFRMLSFLFPESIFRTGWNRVELQSAPSTPLTR